MKVQPIRSIHVLSLGFCALVAQTVFIREMMALFTGTEFVIGAILAGWLFWIALGGILGGRLIGFSGSRGLRAFKILAVSAALLLPLTTVAVRLGRGFLASPPGELPPFLPALIFSLLTMAPFGFIYGMLYNVASGLWGGRSKGLSGGVSRVYILEAAGSLIGALVFSVILLTVLSQLEIAFAISFIVLALILLFSPERGFSFRALPAVILIGAVYILIAPAVDRRSIEAVFPGYRVERFLSSRYGEIVAASNKEVVSFFSGGGRLFSVPEPERAEEVVHIPLLAHPEPGSLLLIGGSLGGGWEEAVKHPEVVEVDCLELDGGLLDLAFDIGYQDHGLTGAGDSSGRSSSPEGGGAERTAGNGASPKDGRVRFITGDGRFFLAGGRHAYDVVILNAPPPVNLQWNRFYTREFFGLVKRSLKPGGIFAFSQPASENFLSNEQARVLRVLQVTLGEVFGEVKVLPGATTHFLAGVEDFDVGEILERLEERKVVTRFINEDFLPYRFSSERMDGLNSRIESAGDTGINTDMKPVLPLYEILLEAERVGSPVMGVFERLLGIPPFILPFVLGAVLVCLFVRSRGGRAARLSVLAVGFGSFLLQLLVLMAYQAFSGHLYHTIVMLTALFMAGASLGALFSSKREGPARKDLRLIHCGFILLSFLLVAWMYVLKSHGIPHSLGASVFLIYSLTCGFLTGCYYPVVVRTALPAEGRVIPAVFYAWDMLGACMGGMLGGILLFPLTGMAGTVFFVIFIHAAAAIFLPGKW